MVVFVVTPKATNQTNGISHVWNSIFQAENTRTLLRDRQRRKEHQGTQITVNPASKKLMWSMRLPLATYAVKLVVLGGGVNQKNRQQCKDQICATTVELAIRKQSCASGRNRHANCG
jgi:hypothetical protein